MRAKIISMYAYVRASVGRALPATGATGDVRTSAQSGARAEIWRSLQLLQLLAQRARADAVGATYQHTGVGSVDPQLGSALADAFFITP